MMGAAWAAVIALVLTALDGLMTAIWVREEYATEGNPIIDYFISRFGLTGGMALRVAYGALLVGVLYALAQNHRAGVWGLWFVATAMTAVVVWHAVGLWTVVVA